MLLSAPQSFSHPPLPMAAAVQPAAELNHEVFLISDLSKVIPREIRPLTPEEEEQTAAILGRHAGFTVSAEYEKKRLNRTYGLMGAEQHLARFPGDAIATHFDTQDEAEKFYASGMAPGLGAWGYFVSSRRELAREDTMREKYYIAVPTFLIPDYNQRIAEYRDFFKYRKMLVVNPQNGKAIVAVIADAGPAEWTGKHAGGSPEVMGHLERADGLHIGPVLYFFVHDPEDKIPLGPVAV